MIFDLIQSQYGYTFQQIRKMTFKEVFIAFTSICKRRKEEMKFQAACLGAKVDDEGPQAEQVSEDQNKMFEEMAMKTLQARGLKKWRTPN